jgi:hypothetical protein
LKSGLPEERKERLADRAKSPLLDLLCRVAAFFSYNDNGNIAGDEKPIKNQQKSKKLTASKYKITVF